MPQQSFYTYKSSNRMISTVKIIYAEVVCYNLSEGQYHFETIRKLYKLHFYFMYANGLFMFEYK